MERFPIARSAIAAVLLACHSSSSVAPTTTATKISASTASGLRVAKWGTNVTIAYADGYVQYQSNGLPNHARQAQYALPSTGVMVPSATTAYAGADPTLAQNYNFRISTNPTKASATTSTSGGTIGVMISGASLFNPYEGDQRTVAMAGDQVRPRHAPLARIDGLGQV